MTSLFFKKLRAVSREAIAVCAACVILIGCGGDGGGLVAPAVMPPVVMTPDPMTPDPMMPEPPVVMPPVVMPPVVMPPVVMPPTSLTFTASAGADTFSITTDLTGSPAMPLESVIDGLTGDDTLQLNTGAVVRNIAFSSDAPTGGDVNLQSVEIITINGGTIGSYTGNNSNNIFELRSGTVTGGIGGISGNNRFTLLSGMVTGNINAGGGNDTITLSGSTLTGNVNGNGGNDTITLSGGTLNGNVDGGGDNDTITLSGGTVTGDILGGADDDTVTVLSGAQVGAIDGGAGTGDRFVWGTGLTTTGVMVSGTRPNQTFAITGNDHDGNGNEVPDPTGFEVFVLAGGTIGTYTGSANADTLEFLSGSVTGNIDGGAGNDFFTLSGMVTGNVDGGSNNDNITLSGGTITGNINGGGGVDTFNLSGGTVGGNVDGGAGPDTFNLQGGTITGNVLGGVDPDVFNLYSAIAIGGFLDGGANIDVLNYAGATGTDFTARGGLADEDDIRDADGDVRNIESQVAVAAVTSLGAGLRGAFGFEVLGLSPALNLYGAMSDALMQFGQQTAQGFALADLDLATGRGTSLVSKDSPFSKGRIWAHKITHSGNGKGSIGLNLTGLTARADSDYDYEMSLTQHGFDAPLMTTRLGAFNLRAVSHTVTGVIETNVAEAKVSGYGAGVALLWNSETLSAHITSLAGGYEVEAHTSPLNPRAVVSEVSEGSFSAVNAVVSAGVADTRKLAYGLSLRTSADVSWQTLSLDDFTETGADGIIINFDKATRFTARVGAGLEAEHWFSDVVFVHETSSGGTLSSGLSQDYRQDDGTAFEMKLGGKIADLATGLTLKAYAGLRTSLINGATIEPSARFDLSWRF